MKLVGSKPSQPASRTPSDRARTAKPMRAKRFILRPSTLARAGAKRHQLLHAGARGGGGLRIRHDHVEPALGRGRIPGTPSSKHKKFARSVAKGAIIRRERLEAPPRLVERAGTEADRPPPPPHPPL